MPTGIVTHLGVYDLGGVLLPGSPPNPPDPPDPPDETKFVPTSLSVAPNPGATGATLTATLAGTARSDGTNPNVGSITDSAGRVWVVASRTPTMVTLTTTG